MDEAFAGSPLHRLRPQSEPASGRRLEVLLGSIAQHDLPFDEDSSDLLVSLDAGFVSAV
jgi:hypothetical protein